MGMRISGSWVRIAQLAMLLLPAVFGTSHAQAGAIVLQGAITNSLCSIYFVVNTIMFVLALMLMILGGALYAGANLLPGQTRGAVQAYAMGLVIGGTAGAIIGMAAPWILQVITGNTVADIIAICPSPLS